jgi:DNA-binding beta-propeller fold protein YncE
MSPSFESRRKFGTRRVFLHQAVGGAVALALTGAGNTAPSPVVKASRPGGFLVLDDCDPAYKGKASYEDNLSFFDSSGKLVARVSGLNNCQEIGSPHKIAIDRKREVVWAAENVGHRLLRFDLKGRKLGEVENVHASALAIDPASGNVWVARGTGRIGQGSLDVYDPTGRRLVTHDHHGWDIAYDQKGKAFWLADTNLLKVSLLGRVVVQVPVAGWCASSLEVNQKTGSVWVATRHHSAALGKNALVGFENEGRRRHEVELGARSPLRVSVDSSTGCVWVTIIRGPLLKYTADGKPDGERNVKALAADVEPGTGAVWVATQEEVLKLDRTGKVVAKASHKATTSQAWVLSY